MEPKSIAEQAKIRGVEVPVGLTAGEIRVLGFTVCTDVPAHAVLKVDNNDPTWIRPEGQAITGYAFVWPAPSRIDQVVEEIAKQEDVNFIAEIKKAVDGK